MASANHRTFREVHAHTAKCEKCGRHNTSILYRCTYCAFPICTPCWNAEGGTGKHKSIATTESPVILPPLPPNKSKKKDKPATRVGRQRKNVVLSDNEGETDEEIPNVPAEIETPKKQSVAINTDQSGASLDRGNTKQVPDKSPVLSNNALIDLQYSEDVLKGAYTLLDLAYGADTPTYADTVSLHPQNSDVSAVIDAVEKLDRQQMLSPTQEDLSICLMSDTAAHHNNPIQKRYRPHNPLPVPKQQCEDVDTYKYGSASSFTPINARKENLKDEVYRHDAFKRLNSLAELRQGIQSSGESSNQRKQYKRYEDVVKVMGNARGMKLPGKTAEEIDSDIEILGERTLGHAD